MFLNRLRCPSLRQNRYCFWYYRKGAQKESRDPSEAYESGIKVVDSFQTVEHFWRIYNHMLRADQVQYSSIVEPTRLLYLVLQRQVGTSLPDMMPLYISSYGARYD